MPTETPPPSKEILSHLIRSLYTALSMPNWTREDLISLGQVIYNKTPLAQIDEHLFDRLLPHLSVVAQHLHTLLANPISTPPSTTPLPTDQETSKT